MTASALKGNNLVPISNPKSSINPGPAIVAIPLLVIPINPIKTINIILVSADHIPNILIPISTIVNINIVFTNLYLSPMYPHKKLPNMAVIVFTTRQYPRK